MSISLKQYEISKKKIFLFSIYAIVITVLFDLLFVERIHFGALYDALRTQNASIIQDMFTGPSQIISNTLDSFNENKKSIESSFGSIPQILTALGVIFAMFIFGVKLCTELQNGQNGTEQTLKTAFEFFVTVIIILYADYLVSLIDILGEYLRSIFSGLIDKNIITPDTKLDFSKMSEAEKLKKIKEILNMAKPSDVYYEYVDKMRENLGLKDSKWGMFVLYLRLALPNFLSKIQSILIKVATYSVLIELLVRKLFLSFAIADIGYEGMRSSGYRYIKRFFACYVKFVVMIAVCMASSALLLAVAGQASKSVNDWFIINVLGIQLSACMLVFKGADWANDIVGAN